MTDVSADRRGSDGRHRPLVRVVTVVLAAVLVWLVASRCTPHPVGPARTYGKYEGKAVTTAKSALSDVGTVQLGARAGSDGRAFGPYLSVLVSDAEESLSGVQSTFESIQPPDARADDLRDELGGILGDALDHVTDVRVAVRRGELDRLDQVARPLDEDARKLKSFTDRHQ